MHVHTSQHQVSKFGPRRRQRTSRVGLNDENTSGKKTIVTVTQSNQEQDAENDVAVEGLSRVHAGPESVWPGDGVGGVGNGSCGAAEAAENLEGFDNRLLVSYDVRESKDLHPSFPASISNDKSIPTANHVVASSSVFFLLLARL
jgi:nitrogenase subunit NifH